MIFTKLIENSLEAGILILAVLIVTLLMRHKAKIYSYILWILVFAWMLIPIRIPMSVGILPEISLERAFGTGVLNELQETVSDGDSSQNGLGEGREKRADLGNALQNEEEDVHKGNVPQSEANDNEQGTIQQNGTGDAQKGGVQQSEVSDSGQGKVLEDAAGAENNRENDKGLTSLFAIVRWIWPDRLVFGILCGIWFLGAVVMACHGAWGGIRLQRSLRSAVCCETFGVKNVYQCAQIDVPIVSGVFRSGIYLPKLNLEPYQRQYILEHEQMHIRRKDSLIKAVSYGLLCLHWFNPLVWLAFLQLEGTMEFSCDEAVVSRLGEEQKKEYSRTLLIVAAGGSLPKKKSVFLLGFLENNIKKRVKNVLEYEHHGKWVTTAVSMILIGCFVCFLSGRGNFLTGNGWKNSAAKQDQGKTDGSEGQRREEGSGLPVIVVNKNGNIIGTHRGKELKYIVLYYINDMEDGNSSTRKSVEGYRIESGAFSDCGNMEKLVVVNSKDVTYVAEDAFQGCPSGLEVYCGRDTYLWKRLPKLGVKTKEYREDDYTAAMLVGEKRAGELEQKAFESLPEKWKEDMQKDFGGPVMSAEAYGKLSKEEIREYEGTPYFIMTEAGRLLDIGGSMRIEAQILRESVEYPSEARSIGMLFSDVYGIKQAEIPAWIEEIGNSTYSGSGLKRIAFGTDHKTSKLKRIDMGAFFQCSFSDSPKLVIPEGVTEIGANAFGSCSDLEEIVLPKSLKKIGGDCFAGCTSLKKVTVKSSDAVFDEENSQTVDGIFSLCGVEYIEEKGEFTESEMVLCGPEGSTAQKYAKEHGIRYRSGA